MATAGRAPALAYVAGTYPVPVADVGEEHEHVLFVHAHPDDETIATGGTIAILLGRGAAVTVLTCARGERGEVVPPELKQLEGDSQALGAYREGELAAAMRILGVADHRILGNPDARVAGVTPRRYHDSGMRWGPNGPEAIQDADPQALCSAEFGEVVSDIATVIAAVQPSAVVSYGEDGGYGHPDHVRVHEAASHAALVLGVPFFTIVPAAAESAGDRIVDITPVLGVKTDALRAHRTQLTVAGDTIVHSGGQVEPIGTTEAFRRYGDPALPGLDWAGLGPAWKAAAGLLALAIGVVVGLIATVNHQLTASPGLQLPVGTVASLALCAALLVGGRLYFGTRIVAGCAALGLLAVVTLLSAAGPGGSVLVPANPSGWTWTIGSAVIAAVVLAWPRPGAFVRATMGVSPMPGKDVHSP